MQLFDAEGRRLYVTEEERRAFVAAASKAPREVRTFCGVLHATGCRISEALALTAQQIDLSGRVVVFESLKKRKRGIFRAVPVPPELPGFKRSSQQLCAPISAARQRPRPVFSSPRFCVAGH